MGANTRIYEGLSVSITPEQSEMMINLWFIQWVYAMGNQLPDKFYLAGFGNGGFNAGVYAAKHPDKVAKLLLLSPAQFCPKSIDENFDPYKINDLKEVNERHIYSELKACTHDRLTSIFKADIRKSLTDLGDGNARTLAEYRARIVQDQDLV